MQPVTIPANATAFLDLEQQTGRSKPSGPSITGPANSTARNLNLANRWRKGQMGGLDGKSPERQVAFELGGKLSNPCQL